MIYTHVLNKGGRGVVSPLDGPQRNTTREPRAAYRVVARERVRRAVAPAPTLDAAAISAP